MNTFTLLHLAGSPARVTVLDARVLSFAICAFALVLAALWAPSLPSPGVLLRRRVRRRIIGHAAALAVFLAVMPTVLPWDHLFFAGAGHESAAEESVHASHCHESPGTCSDAPVSSGPGQLLHSAPLLVTPIMLAVLMLFDIPGLTGITVRPKTRPPLPALRTAAV